MARPVIKAFIDKTRGGRLYAPASRLFNTYEGEREEELFEKGYLGEEEATDVDTDVIHTPDSLEDLTKDEIKSILNDKGIDYPKSALKDELIAYLTQE
ncbi:hypothetical protein ACF3NG_06805 [Aerococcaceae bacterium WGS1372]